MSEKPLHVQVAEALGCKPYYHEGHDWWLCECEDSAHVQSSEYEDGAPLLITYDTDWSATGLLIEKYAISLVQGAVWTAMTGLDLDPDDGTTWCNHAEGSTALLAACNLILALHKAGKLTS